MALAITPALLEQLQKLGSLDCTEKESAAYLGVSEADYVALIATSKQAADALERGRHLGNVALRQRQLNLAKTNAGMAIHLGKERLGQRPATPIRAPKPATAQIILLRGHKRPHPPEDLLINPAPRFMAAPGLSDWFRAVFIDDGGPLNNPEHVHLQQATIGALWTNVPNGKAGRRILGTAELGDPGGTMGKWAKERARQQVMEWFGTIPDFVMTIDATYVAECDEPSLCALIEHELMHMAQATDPFGAPKFRKDGRPAFTIRGHDIEEFVGVVRRYGSRAAGVEELVAAANRGPEIAPARIAQACGTCLGKRAA